MGVNRDKPDLWKEDIVRSVDMYNKWFLRFAPTTFRKTREHTTEDVTNALVTSRDLLDLSGDLLKDSPRLLRTLRMSACPPLAVERTAGLAGVSLNLIQNLEKGRLPVRMNQRSLDHKLAQIVQTIETLIDRDIFVWLDDRRKATKQERLRAAMVIADRLTGADANPIVRNSQEKRQLRKITNWLRRRGYRAARPGTRHSKMDPGTFALRLNITVEQAEEARRVNIPIDVVIMPKRASSGDMPLLIEAKSAGDFTNVNKRRKEEATKFSQLRATYGNDVVFVLFLCGYFDSGYLGYEAAEGIDWIWEHRMADIEKLGL